MSCVFVLDDWMNCVVCGAYRKHQNHPGIFSSQRSIWRKFRFWFSIHCHFVFTSVVMFRLCNFTLCLFEANQHTAQHNRACKSNKNLPGLTHIRLVFGWLFSILSRCFTEKPGEAITVFDTSSQNVAKCQTHGAKTENTLWKHTVFLSIEWNRKFHMVYWWKIALYVRDMYSQCYILRHTVTQSQRNETNFCNKTFVSFLGFSRVRRADIFVQTASTGGLSWL